MKPIVLTGYHGIHNTLDPDRIKVLPSRDDALVDLAAASNVYLDEAGKPHGRDGYTLIAAYAGTHSAFAFEGKGYCVRNGVLYQFDPNGGFAPLCTVYTDEPMRWWPAAGRLFFSNGVVIGEVVEGTAGIFTSPTKDFKDALPAGQALCFYRGKLYSAVGFTLYESDPGHAGRYDVEKGFKDFPEDITMLAPTLDGIYAGTTKAVYFGQGDSFKKMAFVRVADHGAKDIQVQYLDASKVSGVNVEGAFPVFATDSEIMYGLPQGQLMALTRGRYNMPDGSRGTSFIQDIDGQILYVAVYR